MPEGPRVAFVGGRTRLFDASGKPWTIYDCRRANGRIRRTAIASDLSTWRVFVDPNNKRFAYRFRPRESRELDPSRLVQQLNRARWAATFQPNRKSRR
jgi:hypothetical protein